MKIRVECSASNTVRKEVRTLLGLRKCVNKLQGLVSITINNRELFLGNSSQAKEWAKRITMEEINLILSEKF